MSRITVKDLSELIAMQSQQIEILLGQVSALAESVNTPKKAYISKLANLEPGEAETFKKHTIVFGLVDEPGIDQATGWVLKPPIVEFDGSPIKDFGKGGRIVDGVYINASLPCQKLECKDGRDGYSKYCHDHKVQQNTAYVQFRSFKRNSDLTWKQARIEWAKKGYSI